MPMTLANAAPALKDQYLGRKRRSRKSLTGLDQPGSAVRGALAGRRRKLEAPVSGPRAAAGPKFTIAARGKPAVSPFRPVGESKASREIERLGTGTAVADLYKKGSAKRRKHVMSQLAARGVRA